MDSWRTAGETTSTANWATVRLVLAQRLCWWKEVSPGHQFQPVCNTPVGSLPVEKPIAGVETRMENSETGGRPPVQPQFVLLVTYRLNQSVLASASPAR